MPTHALKKGDIENLQLTKQFIDDNLGITLTITALTRQAGSNRDKLKAGFKQLFGVTIHQYIIQKRMEAAHCLVAQTDKPMKEIASLIGYSQRNFYAVFKQHFGRPPGSVRTE